MRTLDPHDELKEGWEPAQVPPMGPGSGAFPAPEVPLIPPRPSLCHAGCAHYHRLVMQTDAAEPTPVEIMATLPRESRFARPGPAGRTIVRSLPVIHHEIAHYCYPSSGIEIVLGSKPVVECNRYQRQAPGAGRDFIRPAPNARPELDWTDGYVEAVKEWEESYQRLQAESDEFDKMLTEALFPKPKETP